MQTTGKGKGWHSYMQVEYYNYHSSLRAGYLELTIRRKFINQFSKLVAIIAVLFLKVTKNYSVLEWQPLDNSQFVFSQRSSEQLLYFYERIVQLILAVALFQRQRNSPRLLLNYNLFISHIDNFRFTSSKLLKYRPSCVNLSLIMCLWPRPDSWT